MKFFKFPYLVQRIIIPQLPPSAAFLFSTCSKRTLQMTISMNKHPNSEIWFEKHQKTGGYVFYIQEENGKKRYILDMVTKNMLPFFSERLKIILNGEEVRVPCDGITSLLQIGLNPFKDDRFRNILNIFKYLLKLFNISSKVYIDPYLLSIYGCKDPYSKRSDDQSVDYYPSENLSIVPQCCSVRNSTKKRTYILHIEHVIMQDIYSNVIMSLFYFKGKHLLYTNASLGVFFLNIFLKKWKKQNYPNFSSLIIHSAPGLGIDEQLISKEMELKKSEENRVFNYPKIIQKHYKFPDYIKFDSSDGYDLRRDGDGKLATIKVTNDYFMFFVWD